MAKNKEEKTNVMRVLEQKKLAYTPHSYPHEEGVAEKNRGGRRDRREKHGL